MSGDASVASFTQTPADWSDARRDALADAVRQHVRAFGIWKVASSGSSMEPTIPGGSLLEVEPLPEQLCVGDILAWVPGGRAAICCHRVIAVSASGAVLTRGDNRAAPDDCAPPSRHVGVVRRYWVGGRSFGAGLQIRSSTPSKYRRVRQRIRGWAERAIR